MIEERLAHATGALDDIQILVTSCVAQDASGDAKQLAKSVLRRILTSADRIRSRPSWYIHEYETELFEAYLSGQLKACGTDLPCIEVSTPHKRREHKMFDWDLLTLMAWGTYGAVFALGLGIGWLLRGRRS